MNSTVKSYILKGQHPPKKEKNGKLRRGKNTSSIENIAGTSDENQLKDQRRAMGNQHKNRREKTRTYELNNSFLEEVPSNVQVSLEMK